MSIQATVSVPLYQSFEDLVCRVLDYETREQIGPDHEIGIIDGDGLASFAIQEPPTLLGDFRYMISHPGTMIEIKSGRFRRVLGSDDVLFDDPNDWPPTGGDVITCDVTILITNQFGDPLAGEPAEIAYRGSCGDLPAVVVNAATDVVMSGQDGSIVVPLVRGGMYQLSVRGSRFYLTVPNESIYKAKVKS